MAFLNAKKFTQSSDGIGIDKVGEAVHERSLHQVAMLVNTARSDHAATLCSMRNDALRREQGKRLAAARKEAGFTSARSAALECGWPESSYRAHEGGTRTIGQDDAERYTRKFRSYGVKATARTILFGDEGSSGFRVQVVGLIGAGGSIDTAWEQQTEPLFEIEVPFPLDEDAVGFQINGISMWPKYDDGDVVIVSKNGESIDALVHQEAAVRLKDGGRYFKRILRTPVEGLFDLESYNAPTMHNQQIEWGSGLIARVPASRWRRLKQKALKAGIRKARAR